MLTESDINDIQYFWQEKGDLERWVGWNDPETQQRIIAACPELVKLWNDYKTAERLLNLIVENIDQGSLVFKP